MTIVSRPVEMIFTCTPGLVPKPLRFKYRDLDDAVTVDVDQVISHEVAKIGGKVWVTYLCRSQINGVERSYELRFSQDALLWVLYRL